MKTVALLSKPLKSTFDGEEIQWFVIFVRHFPHTCRT
jgi:hypothetical protein